MVATGPRPGSTPISVPHSAPSKAKGQVLRRPCDQKSVREQGKDIGHGNRLRQQAHGNAEKIDKQEGGECCQRRSEQQAFERPRLRRRKVSDSDLCQDRGDETRHRDQPAECRKRQNDEEQRTKLKALDGRPWDQHAPSDEDQSHCGEQERHHQREIGRAHFARGPHVEVRHEPDATSRHGDQQEAGVEIDGAAQREPAHH